jgi:pimeloyl-ACP methyl ester carboxylesterase
MASSLTDWTQAASKHGLVLIGTHSLFLSTAGPRRTPSHPVVIIEAGHSDSSDEWPPVMRAISPFARVYSYDRAGYGKSEPSPSPRTASNIVAELSTLLDATALHGPYLLVEHSYGGVLPANSLHRGQRTASG